MTDDLAAMWLKLADRPADPVQLSALADRCEEEGDAATSYGIKWCLARKKRPRRTPKGRQVYFVPPDAGWSTNGTREYPSSCTLPGCVFPQFWRSGKDRWQLQTLANAYLRLGASLLRLEKLVSLRA